MRDFSKELIVKTSVSTTVKGKNIFIPEDATNGEAINMVFPNLAIIKETHSIYVFQGRIMIMRVDRDWWNAKYKGGI